MTRFLLLMIVLFYIPIESYSFNIKKILTPSELDSLSKGYELFVVADSTYLFEGMTGTLRIKSNKSKLIYCMIGEWKEYFQGTKNIKAFMIFDSLGCFQIYKQYTKTGFNEYDCVYQKTKIENETYLIETFRYYYENGQLCETGQRFRKHELKNGYTNDSIRLKKTGLWTFYYTDGTLAKKKDHGKIKKQ